MKKLLIFILISHLSCSVNAQTSKDLNKLREEIDTAFTDTKTTFTEGQEKTRSHNMKMVMKKAPDLDLSSHIKAFKIYSYSESLSEIQSPSVYMKGTAYFNCLDKSNAIKSGLIVNQLGEVIADYDNKKLIWKTKSFTGQAQKDYQVFQTKLCS